MPEEIYLFRLGRLGPRALRLYFSWAARTVFEGVRLNTSWDSFERAKVRGQTVLTSGALARAAIQRRGPVQKLSSSSPTRSPFNAKAVAALVPRGIVRLQFFAEVRLGRLRQNVLISSCVVEGCSLRR